MKTHFLKTWTTTFQKSWDGDKPWEVRVNDRGFQAMDTVVLLEYDPTHKTYSGRWLAGVAPFLIEECFGIKDGHVVMSVHFFDRGSSQADMPEHLLQARQPELVGDVT